MSALRGPNPVGVITSILRARRVRQPSPQQPGRSRHTNAARDESGLARILDDLKARGVAALADHRSGINEYRDGLASIDPDDLRRDEALAYWINLYNAGALGVAAEAIQNGQATVLSVTRGFQRPWATVAGEDLSLDDIEHGKIRRFGDPRIHGSLVCGSASCPTLRHEPFGGADVDGQLEDQMRSFLADGGAVADRELGRLTLSRVFLWYGRDFTRPNRMPTLAPARRVAVADALGRWLAPDVQEWRVATGPGIVFQDYDWSLACAIR